MEMLPILRNVDGAILHWFQCMVHGKHFPCAVRRRWFRVRDAGKGRKQVVEECGSVYYCSEVWVRSHQRVLFGPAGPERAKYLHSAVAVPVIREVLRRGEG